MSNCKEWLQKPNMSKPVAEALFTPIVKFSKDKATGAISDKYPPNIKVKVPFWEGEWKCDAYKKGEASKVEGDLEELVAGRISARAIIECGSIWFAGGKYGTTWNLKAIEYESADALTPSTYNFRGSRTVTQTEKVSLTDATPQESTTKQETNSNSTEEDEDYLDDSDAE